MSESSSNPDYRAHRVTDLVVDNIPSYDQLNPPINRGEDPESKRAAAYREELETIVNSSPVTPFKDGTSHNTDLLLLQDKQTGDPLPIILKVLREGGQDPDIVEATHNKYVELLGNEYVEDMTRVTITNPAILQRQSHEGNVQQLEGFVQDLRGLGEKKSLNRFILETKNQDIAPPLRESITIFLERILAAFEKGWVLDLGVLLDKSMGERTENKYTNMLVDDEGVAFIDSGTIFDIDASEHWRYEFYKFKTLCDVFTGKVTPKQAFVEIDKMRNNVAAITTSTLPNYISSLRTDLRPRS